MDKQRVHTDPKHYSQLTDQFSPPSKMWMGLLNAFWVGGVICVLGQGVIDLGAHVFKLSARDAGSLASIVLVFLTALLTGIGVFDKIGKYAGSCPLQALQTPWFPPRWSFAARGLS